MANKKLMKGIQIKLSEYKSYDELPLFLNAAMVAKVLGVSPSNGYELMHEPDFPMLKVGNRMVVPKEKFAEWVEQHTHRDKREGEEGGLEGMGWSCCGSVSRKGDII